MASYFICVLILLSNVFLTVIGFEILLKIHNVVKGSLSIALVRFSMLFVFGGLAGFVVFSYRFSSVSIDASANAFLVWVVFVVFYLFKFYFPRQKIR